MEQSPQPEPKPKQQGKLTADQQQEILRLYEEGRKGAQLAREYRVSRQAIDQLQRAQLDTMEVNHYTEHYQMFLFFGILLALLELFMGERKAEGRIWRGRFEVPVD